MNENTATYFTADILPSDDRTPWHPVRKAIKRDGPPFPTDKDIDLWLKHNAPLSFESLADIRYALYHHCSRAEFAVSMLADSEFSIAGRYSTLTVINDDARHYLLWKLRLLGRKNKWIRALPRTKNPRT
jgi:hypothetical protein